MAANIRSRRNGITPIDGASRDDLRIGDTITVESIDSATTYAWTLAFAPEGSSAVFSGDVTAVSPGGFVVDKEGPYLVRLTVDASLPSESSQYVRLRALTIFGDLKLVSAGERRDGTGIIPVDVSTEGWANEQNFNLQTLLSFVESVSSSGRIFYVDANSGTEGYADYSTIQAAIDAAETAGASLVEPWIIAVRPGLYVEDVVFKPHIHVIGWPGNNVGEENIELVLIRTDSSGSLLHTVTHTSAGDITILSGLTLRTISNSTNPVLSKTGSGLVVLHRCQVDQEGLNASQGPAVELAGGLLTADHCILSHTASGADTRMAFTQTAANTTAQFNHCIIKGPSGIDTNTGLDVSVVTRLRDTRVISSGGASSVSIQSSSSTLLLDYSSAEVSGTGVPILIHPSAGVQSGGMSVVFRWSLIEGDVSYDVTGIAGSTSLSLGSSEYGALSFPGGAPTTTTATTKGTSLFYDNTSTGMTAVNVQDAIDEVHGLAVLVTTLDDAYDGGVPASGSGRTVIADQGAVQIVDAASPSDPPPAGNTDGNLQVVGSVEIGSIGKPEIDLDPNPYGSGPFITMGQAVVPDNSPFGAGTAFVMGNSTGSTLFRNYNLRVQTRSSDGGGDIGRLILRGGDSFDGGTPPDAASVYIQAGDAYDATAGSPGDVYLSPGYGAFGPTSGIFKLANPAASTAATLTGAGIASDPIGVTGTVRFATNMGAQTASLVSTDSLATVVSKLDALEGINASEAAGVITLTTDAKGPNAEIYFLSADVGVDAALGGFDGVSQVDGTFGEIVDLACTGIQEITIGGSGATGPLVYNAVTGKLTVPGVIDPTALILTQAVESSTSSGEGVLFVGDGSGPTTAGNLYYRANGGSLTDISAGSINNTLDQAYDQGGAGAGRTITADTGAVVINNAVGDASHTLELTRTVGTGAALDVGGALRIFGDGDVVVGGTAMSGTELLRVVGDARVEGKLTVTGLIDPTGLILDEAATPTVAANQTALFVSDGTGGLTQGRIYFKDDSGEPPVNTSGMPPTQFAFNDTSPMTITALKAGDVVVEATVVMETVFDDGASTVEVGVTGQAGRFLSQTDIDPTSTDVFSAEVMDVIGAPTNLILTITPGTSTQGAGKLILDIRRV